MLWGAPRLPILGISRKWAEARFFYWVLFNMQQKKSRGSLDEFPEPLLDEVLDFVHFLKGKIISGNMVTAFASESSLTKNWLRPEEDEAWQNL